MPLSNQLWALAPDMAHNVLTELAGRIHNTEGQSAGQSLIPGVNTGKLYLTQKGVAVIPVHGTITRTTKYFTQGQDTILAALNLAVKDPSVQAILLDINSPGGTVPGTKELADKVYALSKIKPMAAYADGLMASAAMWIGASTGRVFAPVTASVGSVGVIWVHTDFSKLNEKWGISYSYITGGKLKAAGYPDKPLTDEEQEHFQKQVTQLHTIFKADVIRGLGITAPDESWTGTAHTRIRRWSDR